MSGDIASAVGGGVDATRDDAPTGDFQPLPGGWYPLLLVKAQVEDNKTKSGKVLKAEFNVLGDRYSGRKLFERFNLSTQRPEANYLKAVEIGLRNLGGLGKAVGIPVVTDTGELTNKVVDGRVRIRPAGNGYEADNEVAAFAPGGSKTSGQAVLDAPGAKGGAKAAPSRTPGPSSAPPPPRTPAPTVPPAPAAQAATGAPATKADGEKMPWE